MRLSLLVLLLAVPALADEAPSTTGVDLLNGRFEFGSYGRVSVGSDLKGQLGGPANITVHGPRLLENSYAELELRREDTFGDVKSRVVTTLAFFAPFFHFDGNAAQSIALRNLYAEATVGRFSAWAGSRMYRGNDIYLLDFWPLDNLNTVGAGAAWQLAPSTRLAVHAGMQRLDSPSTSQYVIADNPLGYGSVSVLLLDRPRAIESVKLTHELSFGDGVGARLTAYAETHELPAGVKRLSTGDEQALPGDWGVLGGVQLSAWMPGNRFMHLFLRQTTGLATYDALATPSTFNNNFTTQGAHATRLALSAGWDSGQLGVMAGGYLDLVRDAGISALTAQKYDESALSVRGQWYATKLFGVSAEASVQHRTYSLLDASGALRAGNVVQLGLMPYFSPTGNWLFARPQLRLVYALTLRDAGARSFYPSTATASRRDVEQFVGVSVEWWLNSSTYSPR